MQAYGWRPKNATQVDPQTDKLIQIEINNFQAQANWKHHKLNYTSPNKTTKQFVNLGGKLALRVERQFSTL